MTPITHKPSAAPLWVPFFMLLFGMQFLDAHPDLREIYRAWLARCNVACSKTLPYEPAREEFGFGSRGDHEHAKARRKWARSIVDDDAAQSYFAGVAQIRARRVQRQALRRESRDLAGHQRTAARFA